MITVVTRTANIAALPFNSSRLLFRFIDIAPVLFPIKFQLCKGTIDGRAYANAKYFEFLNNAYLIA